MIHSLRAQGAERKAHFKGNLKRIIQRRRNQADVRGTDDRIGKVWRRANLEAQRLDRGNA